MCLNPVKTSEEFIECTNSCVWLQLRCTDAIDYFKLKVLEVNLTRFYYCGVEKAYFEVSAKADFTISITLT